MDICFNKLVTDEDPYWLLQEHSEICLLKHVTISVFGQQMLEIIRTLFSVCQEVGVSEQW
jgi:hypothetical protein